MDYDDCHLNHTIQYCTISYLTLMNRLDTQNKQNKQSVRRKTEEYEPQTINGEVGVSGVRYFKSWLAPWQDTHLQLEKMFRLFLGDWVQENEIQVDFLWTKWGLKMPSICFNFSLFSLQVAVETRYRTCYRNNKQLVIG